MTKFFKSNFLCVSIFISFELSICSIDDFAIRRTSCVRRIGGNYGFNGFNVDCIVFANEFHACGFLVFCPLPRIQCVFVIDCRKCNFLCISIFISFKLSICSINNFSVRRTGCVRCVGGNYGFNGFNVVYIVFADKFHTCGFLIFSPRPRIQCVIVTKFFKRNFLCVSIFISFKFSFCRIDNFAIRCTGCVRRICGYNGINGFNVVCIVFANEFHACGFLVFCPRPGIKHIIVAFGGNRLCLKRCWRSSITISIIRFGCLTIPIFFISCRFARFIFRREMLQLALWLFL